MSHHITRRRNPSFMLPALMPAVFILILLCVLGLPATAQEFDRSWQDRQHPIHPRYELSADNLDFGEIVVGETTMMSVTITNTSPGTIPLKIKLSRNCEGFSLPGAGGMHHLRSGQSVSVQVEFSPLDPGDFECRLELGQQVPGVPLLGVGYEPVTDLELDQESLAFAEVIVDSTGTQYLKITNTGTDTHTLTLSFTDDPTNFSLRSGQDGYPLGPGGFVILTIDFTPTEAGPHGTVLILGPRLPRLNLSGTGVDPVGACSASPAQLEFGPLSPGETQSKTIMITNTGNIDAPIRPTVEDPNFSVSNNSTVLRPGRTWLVAVTYAPLSGGSFTTQVDLGNDFCEPVGCTGLPVPDFDPDQDNIGLFFDADLTSNRTTTTEYLETVDVYLAMLNPSDPSGIAAWECRLDIHGRASIVATQIEGNSINVGGGNQFVVGIGLEPLPHSPKILLASFQLLLQGAPGEMITLELRPVSVSSIPGLMAWVPWDDLSVLKPMYPAGGEAAVAVINEAVDATRASGVDSGNSSGSRAPVVTRILPNQPNPFNPLTEIRFELARAGQARLAIYDVSGRLVKTMYDGHLRAARHTLVWQGRDNGGRAVAAGVYYLQMETIEGAQTRKMMLLK